MIYVKYIIGKPENHLLPRHLSFSAFHEILHQMLLIQALLLQNISRIQKLANVIKMSQEKFSIKFKRKDYSIKKKIISLYGTDKYF